MRVVELREDGCGVADFDGSRQAVDLSLVSDPRVGDFVIVHAGFAIERLDPEEADERLALFAQMASERGTGGVGAAGSARPGADPGGAP
jgi:hydrogenase expression/formation protein HypC